MDPEPKQDQKTAEKKAAEAKKAGALFAGTDSPYALAIYASMISAGAVICGAYNMFLPMTRKFVIWILERNLGLIFESFMQPCKSISVLTKGDIGTFTVDDGPDKNKNKDAYNKAHAILLPWGGGTLLAGVIFTALLARPHAIQIAVAATIGALAFLSVFVLLYLMFGLLYVVNVHKVLATVADSMDKSDTCMAARDRITARLRQIYPDPGPGIIPGP